MGNQGKNIYGQKKYLQTHLFGNNIIVTEIEN